MLPVSRFDSAEWGINSDLKELDTWLQGSRLSLNVAKAHAMLICTKPKHKTLGSQDKDLNSKFAIMDLSKSRKQSSLVCKSIGPWIGNNKSRQFLARSQGQ